MFILVSIFWYFKKQRSNYKRPRRFLESARSGALVLSNTNDHWEHSKIQFNHLMQRKTDLTVGKNTQISFIKYKVRDLKFNWLSNSFKGRLPQKGRPSIVTKRTFLFKQRSLANRLVDLNFKLLSSLDNY